MKRLLAAVREERGTVLVLVMALLAVLLMFGGFAVDIANVVTVKGELQRAIDAGALAGAGNIGFDNSTLVTATTAAATFANSSAHKLTGGITPTLSAGGGNITTGHWNDVARSWTPSNVVTGANAANGVRCQWTATIPTTFFGIIGMNTMSVTATATAVSCPVCTQPVSTPVFPAGLPQCAFTNGGNGASGCGKIVCFGQDCPGGVDSAAWVLVNGTSNPGGSAPSATQLNAAVDAVFNGTSPTSPLSCGTSIGSTQSANSSVFTKISGYFGTRYDQSSPFNLADSSGNLAYSGKGWQVLAPVVSISCSGYNNQAYPVSGWSNFVIAQVITNGTCPRNNHRPLDPYPWDKDPDNPLQARCKSPDGSGTLTSFSEMWGYYNCTALNATTSCAVPFTSSLGNHPKLVQ